MKQKICQAFCESVVVNQLPNGIGFGISSKLFEAHNEPAGVYVIGPNEKGLWKLDDSGWVVPMLASSGFDISTKSRLRILEQTLEKFGLQFDHETFEIFKDNVSEVDVPTAAIHFFSALSKVSDLSTWSVDKVRSTFREDVANALREILPTAIIQEGVPAHAAAPDLIADLLLSVPGQTPVALYLAQSEVSLLEAMLLKSESANLIDPPRVAAVLEREKSASSRTRIRALNRLDVLTVYEGDAAAAVFRVAEEVKKAAYH